MVEVIPIKIKTICLKSAPIKLFVVNNSFGYLFIGHKNISFLGTIFRIIGGCFGVKNVKRLDRTRYKY